MQNLKWASFGLARWAGPLLAATLCGCGSASGPRAVAPEDFYGHRPVNEAPFSQTDHPGAVAQRDTQSEPAPPPPASAGRSTTISPAVQNAIASTTMPSSAVATTQPTDATTLPSGLFSLDASTEPSTLELGALNGSASTEPAFQSGQYMTLGTLVAEVNGTPIYANKLLQLEGPTLRSKAKKDVDIKQFEIDARDVMERTTFELINDELEVAAAERTLDSSDKDLAKHLTTMWSQRQITEAGGSQEVAKRKFQSQGKDFEDAEHDQYRQFLQELYYMRKVEPRIEVTAADERRYYKSHLDSEFTRADKADIRMIACIADKHPQDSARSRLEDIRGQAIGGADFTALASSEATNDFRPDNGGFLELSRNSFALTKVEDAIWNLKIGEISEVIEDNNGFYLVKLLNRENGGVKPFDDATVQDQIHAKLFSQQLSDLRKAEQDKLRAEAIIRFEPAMFDAAMEMVMQNYPKWTK
ncbi:MAG: peptidyl-prolyl cis-trans isomerase [Planctomycetota bacterium]|nr:peptidyl-prolyl cis-trans isomerase [Planctomycetota bacterium]